MAFVKSSILKSGGALTAHLLRKKKTTFDQDQMKVEIMIDSPEQDEVKEPESVDSVEEREGVVADENVEEGEEEVDEEEMMKAPSSPRSKLRTLFTVGSINSVSEVVEAQGGGNVEDINVTERVDDAELDRRCDKEQQGLKEEGRNDEEETARNHRYNNDTDGINANTTEGVIDDDDQSQKSESSLQVLFRIVTSGLDFSTDYESGKAKKRREARLRNSAAKQMPVLPPPTSEEEVTIDKDQKLPKEVAGMLNDDIMTQVSELSDSDLTLTLVADGDVAVDTAGCSYCAPMVSVFEDYE